MLNTSSFMIFYEKVFVVVNFLLLLYEIGLTEYFSPHAIMLIIKWEIYVCVFMYSQKMYTD